MQFLILILFLPMVIIGLISSRNMNIADGTVVSGRSMGPWLSSFSYGTAYFKGVTCTEYVRRFGWLFSRR